MPSRDVLFFAFLLDASSWGADGAGFAFSEHGTDVVAVGVAAECEGREETEIRAFVLDSFLTTSALLFGATFQKRQTSEIASIIQLFE